MDTGHDDAAIERVRRELALLGRDHASAPEVPAEVTARIDAALRSGPAHGIPRPRLRRWQVAALVIGLAGAVVGVALAASMLLRTPAPSFPAGPTAQSITVSRPAFPLDSAQVLALTTTAPDFGPLSDSRGCLAALDRPLQVLGARPLDGRGVVLVVAGETADSVVALLVAPDCGAAHPGLLTDTLVRRP
jgi:hypothetical protein